MPLSFEPSTHLANSKGFRFDTCGHGDVHRGSQSASGRADAPSGKWHLSQLRKRPGTAPPTEPAIDSADFRDDSMRVPDVLSFGIHDHCRRLAAPGRRYGPADRCLVLLLSGFELIPASSDMRCSRTETPRSRTGTILVTLRRNRKPATTDTTEKRDALQDPGWSASGFNPSRPDGPGIRTGWANLLAQR